MGFGSYLQPQTLVSICLSVRHAHARMRTHVCCRVPADETLLSARLSTPEKVKAKWRASTVLRQQESLTYAPKYMWFFFLVFFKTCLYLEPTLTPVAVRLFQEGLVHPEVELPSTPEHYSQAAVTSDCKCMQEFSRQILSSCGTSLYSDLII